MKSKRFFPKAVLIALFIIVLNISVFAVIYRENFSKGFSGMAVKKVATDAYEDTSPLSKTLLIVQGILIFSFLITVFVKDRSVSKVGRELKGIDINKVSENSKTDLDTLYRILQEKKVLGISSITSTFKISKETAMDWCKTLEAGNLASIDYPGMGEPVLKIK